MRQGRLILRQELEMSLYELQLINRLVHSMIIGYCLGLVSAALFWFFFLRNMDKKAQEKIDKIFKQSKKDRAAAKNRSTEQNYGRRIDNALRTFGDQKFPGDFVVTGAQLPEGYTVTVSLNRALYPTSLKTFFRVVVDVETPDERQILILVGGKPDSVEVDEWAAYTLQEVTDAIEDCRGRMSRIHSSIH